MDKTPDFRRLVRELRLREEAKAANKCHACGRKLPKKPKEAVNDEN